MLTVLMPLLFAFARDRKGITAMEYGMLAAAILAVLAAVAQPVANELNSLLVTIEGEL